MRDPYLYPHTDVLRTRAGIQSKPELEVFERERTSVRLAEWLADGSVRNRNHDFHGLCQLHRHIFQDVYEWAGVPRIINIEKSERALGGLSVEYSDCFDIAGDAGHVLDDMNGFRWDRASFEEVVRNYSRFMADLWKVHPFREGNTRTVVTFCNCFLMDKGFTMDTGLYKEHAEYVRTALVAADAIFHDFGDKRKPEYLERIVADSLREGWREKTSVLGKLKENQSKLEKGKKMQDAVKRRSRDDREK